MSEWTITEAICGNERMTGRNKKKPKARVCNGHGGPFNEIPRRLVLGPNVPRVAPICRRLRVYQDETPLTSCWARSGNGRATGPEFGDFCCLAAWIEWLDWFDVASLALQLPLFAFHCSGHYAGCGNILPFGGSPVATSYKYLHVTRA